jgi:hypothetical protein
MKWSQMVSMEVAKFDYPKPIIDEVELLNSRSLIPQMFLFVQQKKFTDKKFWEVYT